MSMPRGHLEATLTKLKKYHPLGSFRPILRTLIRWKQQRVTFSNRVGDELRKFGVMTVFLTQSLQRLMRAEQTNRCRMLVDASQDKAVLN